MRRVLALCLTILVALTIVFPSIAFAWDSDDDWNYNKYSEWENPGSKLDHYKDYSSSYHSSYSDSSYVNGYYRSNGTWVNGYYRTKPDGNPYNNYGYPGNYNPNTGKYSTGSADSYLRNYNSLDYGSSYSSGGSVWVNGYYRKNGTYVQGYYRRR